MEIGGSLRGRRAGIDAEECTVAPRSQLCRSGRRSCRTEMGAPGGCPQEPVRAGVGHGRAGRGLGWGWGPGVAARSPRGCDVSAGGPAPARHLCPGRCPWCHPAGSALPARGSMPRIRPPTALMRAWHPCIGTAAGRGGGNHGNGYSASLPALQPRPVLVAAEARSLPPLSPHMC